MKIQDIINELNNKKAELLYTICEDEKVYHPEILIQLVYEVRSIIKLLKMIKEEEN